MMVVVLMVGMGIPMVVVMVRRLMLVMIMVVSPLQFGLKRRCPALHRRPLTRPLCLPPRGHRGRARHGW